MSMQCFFQCILYYCLRYGNFNIMNYLQNSITHCENCRSMRRTVKRDHIHVQYSMLSEIVLQKYLSQMFVLIKEDRNMQFFDSFVISHLAHIFKVKQVDMIRILIENLDIILTKFLEVGDIENLSFSLRPFSFGHSAKSLAQTRFTNIRDLSCSDCGLGNKGIQVLRNANLEFLKALNLCNNRIDKVGAKKLSQCNFRQLQHLTISNNEIGNAGLGWLVKAEWPMLKVFEQRHCCFTADAIKILTHANWPNMTDIQYDRMITKFYKQIACLRTKKLAKIGISIRKNWLRFQIRRKKSMQNQHEQWTLGKAKFVK